MNITKSVGLAAAVLVAATTLTGCTADSGGTTEITYALWGKPQLPLMKQLVAEFEEQHPEISVNIDLTPYAQYFTKLQTQASSDTLPDIFWMNSNVFPLYASNGQLEPITQAIDDGDLVLDDYPAILAKTYEWDGVQYGVPKDFDTIALWYNKALFDEAGQAYPTDDWTWDQYKSVSQEISATLKDKGVFGTALPIDDPQAGYYNSIPQAGGEVISADGSTSGFDSPNSIRGLELWSDLIASGASPDVQQLADTLPVSWFTSGKAAMIWSGSYNASSIAESEFADSIDLVRLPHDETSATVLNGLSNVVAASSENKEAAQTFQNFLGSKEAAEIGAKDGVVIPAFNGTQADWVQTRPEWNLQVFIDAVEDGVPFPRSLNSPVWEKYATDLLPAAWSGSRPVAEVANELADKMNAALAAEK